MITQLRLRNWRSFEALDLAFGPGTTFVVAPNGVGKTSLVLALAWGVFGDAAGVSAQKAVRAGATNGAEVDVSLSLPDGRQMTINRRISASGKASMIATIDESAIEDNAVAATLSGAFGVDAPIAARLALMLGAGDAPSTQSLDLRSHLNHVFGIDHLVEIEEAAKAVAKEATKSRSQLRETNKHRMADRDAVESRIGVLRRELAAHEEHREGLRRNVELADRQRRQAQRIVALQRQQEFYESTLEEVMHQALELLGAARSDITLDPDALAYLVSAEALDIEARSNTLVNEAAEATGRLTAARDATQMLSDGEARCPTCLRSIDQESLEGARTQHHHMIADSQTIIDEKRVQQGELTQRLNALEALRRRLDQLERPDRSEDISDAPSLEESEAEYDSATDAMQHHDRTVGSLEQQVSDLERSIASDDALARAEDDMGLAYRREGIAIAAAKAVSDAVERLSRTQIEPIALEVSHRWKRLFSSEGLTLRPDGTIVRFHGGQELDWETLSGGEQIWARIVTHLLLISSCTQLPFALLDEPLEHLDPKLRHSVASTLAHATAHSPTKQLIVTTYENSIARQLAADTPDSRLVNIRTHEHAQPRLGDPLRKRRAITRTSTPDADPTVQGPNDHGSTIAS